MNGIARNLVWCLGISRHAFRFLIALLLLCLVAPNCACDLEIM